MKVISKEIAWAEADKIFPTDYEKDAAASERAGYPVYYSTAAGVNAWISDLGDRLEVNLPDGKSVNIWVENQAEDAKQDSLPHYGNMLEEKIRETADMGNLTPFENFVLKRGFYFSTEEALKAGYDRQWKSEHGIMLTKEEFLAEANMNRQHPDAADTYDALEAMVAEKKLTPGTVLGYARFAWCLNTPEAVVAYQTGRDQWQVNTCETEITKERAVLEVNTEWGFEASRVKILGSTYYESTDWNWIRFNCAGMAWLMCNGQLYQIYN
jgi:hypothetical protein